jgi:hypothetical protein
MGLDLFHKPTLSLIGQQLMGLAVVCANPICAFAAEITINDCNGVTRAQIALADQSERKDLTIGIEDKIAQAKKVSLKSDSDLKTSEVTNGQAYFENLNSGVYELCPESASAQLTTVNFSTTDKNSISSLGAVALGAAAIGGSVLAIGSGSDNSSGSNQPNSGSVLSQNTGSASLSNAKPSAAPRVPPNSDLASNCLNGQRLKPISPFQ